MENIYYYLINQDQIGPVGYEVIKEKIQSKVINSSTYVWKQGLSEWVPVNKLEEFDFLFRLPPPIPVPPPIPRLESNPSITTVNPNQIDALKSVVEFLKRYWISLVGLTIGIILIFTNYDSSTYQQVELFGDEKQKAINDFLRMEILREKGWWFGNRWTKNICIDGELDIQFSNLSNSHTFKIIQIGSRYMINDTDSKILPPTRLNKLVELKPNNSKNEKVQGIPNGRFDSSPYVILDNTVVTNNALFETKTPVWFKILGWLSIAVSLLLFFMQKPPKLIL